LKYYIIAGELSGDLHASNLMKSLKLKDSDAEFAFWGGDLMLEQGGRLDKHYRETAFMGIVDVVKNLGKIKKNFKQCKSNLLDFNPDVLILVDYPGFNLRMAEFAKLNGFIVHYYISPKVWAWKKGRANTIKKFVDKLFVIFPFEIEFYKQFDYPVEFVGNPLLDAIEENINNKKSKADFLKENNLIDKPIIAILAGSRMQEIKHNLSIMLSVIPHFPEYQFVLAAAPSLNENVYKKYIANTNITVIVNKTYDILQQSEAALITSGTATLEAGLLGIPQLVCYRGDYVSYQIARRVMQVKYISLVNLVADQEIIKEYIQYDMTTENLKEELNKLINDRNYRNQMLENYTKVREILGGVGASERTADIIVKTISTK